MIFKSVEPTPKLMKKNTPSGFKKEHLAKKKTLLKPHNNRCTTNQDKIPEYRKQHADNITDKFQNFNELHGNTVKRQ